MADGKRSTGPGGVSPEAIFIFVIVGVVALVAGVVWGALKIASAINGSRSVGNPFGAIVDLAKGTLHWSGAATGVLVIELVVLLGLAGGSWWYLRNRKQSVGRVDRQASLMAKRSEIYKLTREGAQEKANQLGIADSGPGILIGRTVQGNLEVFGNWEDMHVDIWGPRTGKTTSRAVPAILDAPGCVIATSNKRDIVDATRGPRSAKGPLWVFDPQEVCEEPPNWWWNPLTYITDETKARELAEHFVASQRTVGAQTDAFFDAAGTDLLAGLLLAAAVAKRPITQVYSWLADQRNDEPERILRNTPGLQLSADALAGVINAPDKQRAGVYGTAQQSAQFLVNRKVTRWVVPNGPNDNRPQFNPHEFVRKGGTLYSLSKEGAGTAGPLVTALTVAVAEAAEQYARGCPLGRMPRPLVGVLDEAANVCRWKNLPDLYSHFGSRGIVLMTILQSWAQGQECWGDHGMEKLWGSANIRVYGGGGADPNFLERLSKMVGEYDIQSNSVSYNEGKRGTSQQTQRHNIFDVSALAALPAGRAVVLSSGQPATLVKTVPWFTRPDAGAVKASLAKYDPGAATNIPVSNNPWVASQQPALQQRGPERPVWEQNEGNTGGW